MVGWYSAANKYIDAVAWIPQSAMGAVFPALAVLSVSGKERLGYAFEKSYKMLAILAIPLSVGMVLTAGPLVHLTRGFEQSIGALQLLAPSVFFLFVNNAFIYTLTAMNRQADFTRLSLVSLAVNVVLNLALIPLYGYLGAAAASSLTELGLFLGAWWLLRRQLSALPVLRSVARVLLSGALMGAVVFVIRSWTLLVVIPVAAAVYLAALIWLDALDRQEWAVLYGGLKLRP
jgi:O-antigen/teichoic acid export membrane protein